ncbi:MAG: hypothetical protein DMF91_24325, partial [Acidobacteria bacterium]
MPTIDALAAILTARNLAALQGLKGDEGFWPLSDTPIFVYTARPTNRVLLRGIFEQGPLKQLIEKP